MRILQVINAYYPPFSAGGPALVTYRISKALAKRGHEVTVFTTNVLNTKSLFMPKKKLVNINNMKIYYFNNLIFKPSINVYFSSELVKFIKKEISKYDITHVHEYRSYISLAVSYYAKRQSIPFILQAHGQLPIIGYWKKLKLIYDILIGCKILQSANGVIALTRLEAEQYERMGVPKEKIFVIPNGIDLLEYSDLPPKGAFKEKFNVPEDKRIVLYIGRIHWIKGVDILVRAYALLAKQLGFKDVILVVAGPDDGYLGRVKSLVRELGISDSVLFTGPLYGRDKLSAYVDAEFVVLPSRYETFPNVVLEAYACAKPVIASNVEAMPDIVLHGETGLLFRAGDEKELASALVYLLENPKEAEKMGRNARKLAEEKYSIDKIAAELEKVYEEVIH
jgi:glycosyltransferase involved in cell wall biosynthesis